MFSQLNEHERAQAAARQLRREQSYRSSNPAVPKEPTQAPRNCRCRQRHVGREGIGGARIIALHEIEEH
jgi:hypothetical protein